MGVDDQDEAIPLRVCDWERLGFEFRNARPWMCTARSWYPQSVFCFAIQGIRSVAKLVFAELFFQESLSCSSRSLRAVTSKVLELFLQKPLSCPLEKPWNKPVDNQAFKF